MKNNEIIKALEDGEEIVKSTYYHSKGKKSATGGTTIYKIGEQVIKSTQFDKLREDGIIIKTAETMNTVTYKLSK